MKQRMKDVIIFTIGLTVMIAGFLLVRIFPANLPMVAIGGLVAGSYGAKIVDLYW